MVRLRKGIFWIAIVVVVLACFSYRALLVEGWERALMTVFYDYALTLIGALVVISLMSSFVPFVFKKIFPSQNEQITIVAERSEPYINLTFYSLLYLFFISRIVVRNEITWSVVISALLPAIPIIFSMFFKRWDKFVDRVA